MPLNQHDTLTEPEARAEHIDAPAPAAARARIEKAFAKRSPRIWPLFATLSVIWLLAAAYYFLTPPLYKSKWTLILPAAKTGSSVTLETIGQTSSVPGQPFGSVSLSPKVIYKEIAGSDQVRIAAAESLAMDPNAFGKPRVKLIDETSLINFQIKGRTPEEAHKKAQALMKAFSNQLQSLRRDELEKRAAFVRENLKVDQANLDAIRKKIMDFQRSSGLLSTTQFTEASSSAELLRRRLAQQRADRHRMATQQSLLISRVGMSPAEAAIVLRLAADSSFTRLALEYTKTATDLRENVRRYGPKNPRLRVSKLKVVSVFGEIAAIAKAAGITPSPKLAHLVLSTNTSSQSDLLKAIVANEAALAGRDDEVRGLEQEVARMEKKVAKMGQDAARLEALKKDHLVAEAVFTSAVARLNIDRSDQFSSYPMVQVLAQPSMPMDRSQPRLLYAIAAGMLGSLFILLAWGALWIRKKFSIGR